ncbi:TRAP transporter large permease [Polynucleobacter antarcticus]|uniref:C4-dicarboxylate ABC transporter n=1 Tax=Polynucleobacter antarcticus TaxID=1743162 RepID=A0A6M9PVE6_9BURK|nr:TRAP transporter large permease subunit [Polynucleobacter antarcticus]QKM62897.1 C4-dicarboxylate ABC transporter [Polynucleobacter antarcticus]
MRKDLLFGFIIMALVVISTIVLIPWGNIESGHMGLLMLSLVVVAIMLGFPTAFTLMGMGMIFTFISYSFQNPALALDNTLALMVQRAYAVMTNDVLISIPLFVFMGYLVERANLIEKLFRSLHLALVRVPGSLAVATIFTCAIFATATGIVGAVVTLMGLLALPAMLKAGYDTRVSAGCITAGGCLGILIPPSVLLIVYGATAGVSVVQLYAGAFFPGLMLAGLYIAYVIILAKLKPNLMPPLSAKERIVPLPMSYTELGEKISQKVIPAILIALKGKRNVAVAPKELFKALFIALLPLLVFVLFTGSIYKVVTAPLEAISSELVEMGSGFDSAPSESSSGGLSLPPGAEEEKRGGLSLPPGAEEDKPPVVAAAVLSADQVQVAEVAAAKALEPRDAPTWFWVMTAIFAAMLAIYYLLLTWVRLEIFKMLLGSFFPLAILILFVLGSIVFGLATPTEAAAIGAIGGVILAAAYKQLNFRIIKESVFLTAKTGAMVCWLFVGSSIFSAAFALLGGQTLVEHWVLSLGLSPIEFLILAQVIIFLLGWPLEWTEIIVIFMPIFVPLLDKFGIDPLFFGLLVALNLQTAFLSPPVAMSAFYLKGVAPPHVTLNQIFLGMMPFMGIQVLAIVLLYMFPAIGLWLPAVLYK